MSAPPAFSFNSAKETVTLAVAASYLLVIAAESRVEAATAELNTAEASQQLAEDREVRRPQPQHRYPPCPRRTAGTPAESHRGQQQPRQAAHHPARVLGLPVHQPIRLVSRVPYKPLPKVAEEEALQRAFAMRPDFLAAEQQVKAAELQRKSAEAERLPSVGISGDYGAIGTRPDNAFSTWTVNAGLKVPIFQGGKIEADIRQADAVLAQRKAQRDDLKGRIEQDVADAVLDVTAAGEQVEVASATLDYAQQTLTQSQDRFSAGVTNNIEVIQAQEALAKANQQYIGSLYAHNIAKVLLARAVGAAEQTLRQVLGDQPVAGPQDNAAPAK